VLLDIIPVEASGAEVLVGEVLHTLEESPAGAGVSKGPVLKQKHSSKGLKSMDLAWKPLFFRPNRTAFFSPEVESQTSSQQDRNFFSTF
jgi:hypothetical protein